MSDSEGQFSPEKAFQLIQQQLTAIQSMQATQQTTLSEHTGSLAEILSTVTRLDKRLRVV